MGDLWTGDAAVHVRNAARCRRFARTLAGAARHARKQRPRLQREVVMTVERAFATGLSAAGVVLLSGLVYAAGQYGPGASDTEIEIGNTMPYSGPASTYGIIGKTIGAYFDQVNAAGGINGRKIRFISYDDGYNPQKTVELARRLVEEDQVLFLFATLGTATSAAIRPYVN